MPSSNQPKYSMVSVFREVTLGSAFLPKRAPFQRTQESQDGRCRAFTADGKIFVKHESSLKEIPYAKECESSRDCPKKKNSYIAKRYMKRRDPCQHE
jgi:hypothetical protein